MSGKFKWRLGLSSSWDLEMMGLWKELCFLYTFTFPFGWVGRCEKFQFGVPLLPLWFSRVGFIIFAACFHLDAFAQVTNFWYEKEHCFLLVLYDFWGASGYWKWGLCANLSRASCHISIMEHWGRILICIGIKNIYALQLSFYAWLLPWLSFLSFSLCVLYDKSISGYTTSWRCWSEKGLNENLSSALGKKQRFVRALSIDPCMNVLTLLIVVWLIKSRFEVFHLGQCATFTDIFSICSNLSVFQQRKLFCLCKMNCWKNLFEKNGRRCSLILWVSGNETGQRGRLTNHSESMVMLTSSFERHHCP